MTARKSRLILGLMSGTSHDGIDAALVKVTGSGASCRPKLLHHSRIGYAARLRDLIYAVSGPHGKGGAADICRLNFELGEAFAKAALKCAREAGVGPGRIDAIASHGQTICHLPPEKNAKGSTLQVGESAVIARRTGVPVVSDFRVADMAAGGHGAPLVPYADYLLFRGRGTKVAQNIGGIANVTVVTPALKDVIAFDTGPGNCLMDEAVRAFFGKPFDSGGRIARRGRPDEGLVERLLRHPFFLKKPPRSTGRELFGSAFLKEMTKGRRIGDEDLVCTLAHFTARSIHDAYGRFVFPTHEIRKVVASGGGTKNAYLMGLLAELFRPVPVITVEHYGIPSAAKEALCFALLANETLSGNPSNLPAATGAKSAVVLGKLTPP